MKNRTSISLLRFALMSIMGLSCSALLAAPPTRDVNVVNEPTVNVDGDIQIDTTTPLNVEVTNADPIAITLENTAPTITEIRFVGRTVFVTDGSIEFDGRIGVAAMHKACEAEYGPGARGASIAEAYFAGDGIPGTSAWLAPQGAMVATESAGEIRMHDAASGQLVSSSSAFGAGTAYNIAYCSRYTQTDTQFAPVVNGEGRFAAANCSGERAIACSAPVAIPVRSP